MFSTQIVYILLQLLRDKISLVQKKNNKQISLRKVIYKKDKKQPSRLKTSSKDISMHT